MGRAARPLYDPGNNRSIERRSDLQAARRGSLTTPVKPAGERKRRRSYTTPWDTISNFSANKPAAKSLLTFLSQRPQVEQLVAAGQGYDLPAFAKLHDFKTWADEGPPKGTLYNYPPREDLVASIACAPAPTNIATQMYSQATMTKMIARCTTQGQTIDQAVAWAQDEIEGFMRG